MGRRTRSPVVRRSSTHVAERPSPRVGLSAGQSPRDRRRGGSGVALAVGVGGASLSLATPGERRGRARAAAGGARATTEDENRERDRGQHDQQGNAGARGCHRAVSHSAIGPGRVDPDLSDTDSGAGVPPDGVCAGAEARVGYAVAAAATTLSLRPGVGRPSGSSLPMPFSSRTRRTASTTARIFACASSTVRVFRPQSGST